MNGFASNMERRARMLAQALFRRLYNRRRAEPSDLGNVDRILLVRTDKIGDAIVSTPVIQALRQRFPRAEIDILLGRRNRAAAPLLPDLNNVYVTVRGVRGRLELLRRLRSRRYDVAIDMVVFDSVTAALFTAASGARIKIGFEDSASPFYDFVVSPPTKPMHHVPKLLMLVHPLGIAVAPREARPAVSLLPESLRSAQASLSKFRSGRSLVMINISGSSPRKFWGLERYVDLVRELRSDDYDVILLSAPGDRSMLQEIGGTSGAPFIPPTNNLEEFAALLSFADLVVSPDTSIVHIAAALGKPVVALVDTPVTAIEWAPWGVPHRVVGCTSAISDIPGADVLAAVRALALEVARPVRPKQVRLAGA